MIHLDVGDVRQQDLDPALERPQLVEPLDREHRPIAFNRDVNHGLILVAQLRSATSFNPTARANCC